MQDQVGPLAAPEAKATVGQRLSHAFNWLNGGIVLLKGLPAIGLLGTLAVAYFQYISNYEDKARDLAKEDLAAATAVFAEISSQLSTAMTLQQMLYFTYADALKEPSADIKKSFAAKSASALYQTYSASRTALRENMPVYSRRIEIFIDWPSDSFRDPSLNNNLAHDPVNKSGQIKIAGDTDLDRDRVYLLGAYNFNCDTMMPNYESLDTLQSFSLPVPPEVAKENKNAKPLGVSWLSAKHQLVAFHYCFERLNDSLGVVRRWASESDIAAADKSKFDAPENLQTVRNKLDEQVDRLNAFVALTMRRIEEIRIKYRPVGFWCHVPGFRELTGVGAWIAQKITGHYNRGCSPIRVAEN